MNYAVLKLSGASLLAITVSAAAHAQQVDPRTPAESAVIQDIEDEEQNQVTSADGEIVSETQTITVTGSRIRLPNLNSFEPTVTLDETYLEERNLTNIADALNELPNIRGSVTPSGAQGSFGQGVNFINNFGLGSNRTLTLVNSRRFVSSNVTTIFNQGSAGVQVDLNVIPAALIDRIDVVSIGGAPVYGSDAISGTVNVILKTNFDGLRLSGVSGISEEGDAFNYNGSIVAGRNFLDGRANITASYARDGSDGLLFNSRDFLRDNIGGATNITTAQAIAFRGAANARTDGRVNPNIGFNDSATDGFPGAILVRDRTLPFLTQGGLITRATNAAGGVLAAGNRTLQFDAAGNVVPFNQGIPFVGTQASGGDGFRFNDFSQIRSDLIRDVFNLFGTFEVTPAATLFFEGTYYHARADELVQQPTFNSSLFGNGLSGAVNFSINSPFVTPAARATLAANGISNFQVSRASLDLADLTGFSETDLYRVVAGLRGDFDLLGKNFNYDISGNYGESNITDFGQDLNAQNFINAVNVTRNAAGQIVCDANPVTSAAPGGRPIADANCVPLNLLGFGQASQAARDYVIQDRVTESQLKQYVFNANFGGSPISLFGNPAGFNVGYEHRQEEGTFTPDDFQQQGLGRSVAIRPVSGKFNVDEVFGEVVAPLVTDQNNLSFLNRLEVFARGRYVDNTVNGGFTAYTFGGVIAPIRDIQFRGNYTKSFRAPAITELFSPATNAFSAVADFCSPAARNAGPVPEVRSRNCAAFLAAFPNATPLDAAAATVPIVSGGTPDLDNEVAKSFTYGILLQPRFIPGLSITADYVDIDIEQPIASLGVGDIVAGCFDNPNFNTADPANGNAFCSRIGRFPAGSPGTAANGGPIAGQVIVDPQNPAVRTGFVNGNRIDFSGIQGTIDYRRRFTDMGFNIPGAFEVGGDLFYVRRRQTDITGVAPSRSDGTLGDPEFSAQLNVRYVGDRFGLTTSVNYVGEQLFSRFTRSPDIREFDQLNDYAVVNVSAFVDVSDTFRLNGAVSNIGNRQGQEYFGVLIPASFNDLIGRRFSISARLRY